MALIWDNVKLELTKLDPKAFTRQFLFLIFNLINVGKDSVTITRLLEQSEDPESFVEDVISRCETNLQEANNEAKEHYVLLVQYLCNAVIGRRGPPPYGSYNIISHFYCSLVGTIPTNIFGRFQEQEMHQLLARSSLFDRETNIDDMKSWIKTYLPITPPDEYLPHLPIEWLYNYDEPLTLWSCMQRFYQLHPSLYKSKNHTRLLLGFANNLEISNDARLVLWANSIVGRDFLISLRRDLLGGQCFEQFALNLAALLSFTRFRRIPRPKILSGPISEPLEIWTLNQFDEILRLGRCNSQSSFVLEKLAVPVKAMISAIHPGSPLSEIYHTLLTNATNPQDGYNTRYALERLAIRCHRECLERSAWGCDSCSRRKSKLVRRQQRLPSLLLSAADEQRKAQERETEKVSDQQIINNYRTTLELMAKSREKSLQEEAAVEEATADESKLEHSQFYCSMSPKVMYVSDDGKEDVIDGSIDDDSDSEATLEVTDEDRERSRITSKCGGSSK